MFCLSAISLSDSAKTAGFNNPADFSILFRSKIALLKSEINMFIFSFTV